MKLFMREVKRGFFVFSVLGLLLFCPGSYTIAFTTEPFEEHNAGARVEPTLRDMLLAELLLDIATHDKDTAIEAIALFLGGLTNDEIKGGMGLIAQYDENGRISYTFFVSFSGTPDADGPSYRFEGSFLPVHDYTSIISSE